MSTRDDNQAQHDWTPPEPDEEDCGPSMKTITYDDTQWKLVPIRPTDDMIVAFAEAWYSKIRCIDDCEMEDAYADMLAAAPAPEAEPARGEHEALAMLARVLKYIDPHAVDMELARTGPIADAYINTIARKCVERLLADAAAPSPAHEGSEAKPFGYVVRSTVGDSADDRRVFKQRIFKSAHDQTQCHRQWMEYFAEHHALTPKTSGIWWEVDMHTVYEAPQAQPSVRDAVADRLDPVVEANRALLHQRSQVGIKKYGVTLDEGRYSSRELLGHALEEALDLANYLQAELQRQDRDSTRERAESARSRISGNAGEGVDGDIEDSTVIWVEDYASEHAKCAESERELFEAWIADAGGAGDSEWSTRGIWNAGYRAALQQRAGGDGAGSGPTADDYDAMLRDLCCSLSVGGYNSGGLIDPETARAKIDDGIAYLIEVECERARAALQQRVE